MTLAVLAAATIGAWCAMPASGQAPLTQKQRLVNYLGAVAAARQPAIAFRPQLQAAVADVNNNDYRLHPCPATSASTLLQYGRLLGSVIPKFQAASTKAKLGGPNFGALKIGIDDYVRANFDAQAYYSRIGNACEETADPTQQSIGMQTLLNERRTSAQTWAAINSRLSTWRQAVVYRAGQLHMTVPAWVYTVGTN